MGNHTSKMSSRHIVECTSEVSKSSSSEYVGSQNKTGQGVDIRSMINEETDDSDSEIFRVKRRSSSKVELKIVRDSVPANTEQQVQNFRLLLFVPVILRDLNLENNCFLFCYTNYMVQSSVVIIQLEMIIIFCVIAHAMQFYHTT